MPKAFHVKYWDSIYETAATRQVRVLSYYSKPNKLVGEGLGHMLKQPDGLALYGTWSFLEILASTAPQEHRGWLVRNGSPMDAARMSDLTRIPAKDLERALSFFCTAPMDWLEELEWEEQLEFKPPSDHQRRVDGTPSDHQRRVDGISARGKKDKRKREVTEQEREKRGGDRLSPGDAAAAQTRQFAAAQARLKELEGTAEDERTDEEAAELKKMRRLVRQIQAKQRAGEFTPVAE